MIFVADESVDGQIVSRLRQDGHEVLYVAEMSPGIPDSEVLALACRSNAPLLTADKDFGELVFRQGLSDCGVVLLRLAGMDPATKAECVAFHTARHSREFSSAFTVVSPRRIRIRTKRPC